MSNRPLVIGVGFQKTGTSTLRESLKILGYNVKDATPRALLPILKKDWGKIDRILSKYDAIQDTPWYYIYKDLDRLYPGSKFVLTIRDEEKWYRSVNRHIGDLRSAHHEWIYGRGKGLPMDDKENTIAVYRQHNEEVVEYFKDRPDDFIVIDFTKGESWEKLCPFLGKPMPENDLPHYNKTNWSKKQEPRKNNFKLIRKRIKNAVKIWYIDQRGWWDK